jgi:hypothetical protein
LILFECAADSEQGASQNEKKMITNKKEFLSELCS